jgi:hypothetical protein
MMHNFREWVKSNQAIGVILSLVLTALLGQLLFSPWVFRRLADGFYLGFFPILSVGLLLLVSLTLIFDSQRKKIPAELENLTSKSFLWALLMLGGCWLYFVAMREIGFLIITPIFLFLTAYILGLRPWWKCIIGAVTMKTIVFLMFSLLGIKLPPGILAGIL